MTERLPGAAQTLRFTGPGAAQTLRFTGLADDDKPIEIWLPHNAITELGSLRANTPIQPVIEADKPIWLKDIWLGSQNSASRPSGR